MKTRRFLIFIIITFILEALVCFYFYEKIEAVRQDPVAVNACLKSIEANYGDPSLYDKSLDYAVIDNDEALVFATRRGLSETINDAIKNNDTILDITVDQTVVGKLIVKNMTEELVDSYKLKMIAAFVLLSLVQAVTVTVFYMNIKKNVTEPFRKMNDFAVRVAGGDLEVPLEVDRQHIFGEFTEAFDLMRSELKKARLAEKKANDDKKELIAKLSHDIKTPVASIKSASEIGYELAKDEKAKEYFGQINVKADQITILVENLFTSSVAELTEVTVSPSDYPGSILYDIIRSSDHLKKAGPFEIPECRIYVDKLRIAQVFDNIFMNSYKYAGTPITVTAELSDDYLKLKVADCGPGVADEEIALLKEKYKRGANSDKKDGAGLGLYISDGFMNAMEGKMILSNEHPGFAVTLYIRTV